MMPENAAHGFEEMAVTRVCSVKGETQTQKRNLCYARQSGTGELCSEGLRITQYLRVKFLVTP